MQRSAMPTVQENRFLTKKLVYSHAGLLWHVQEWAAQQDLQEATLHAILSLISNRHLIKLKNIDHDISRQVGEDSFQPCTAFVKLTDLHWKFFQLNVFCSSAFSLHSHLSQCLSLNLGTFIIMVHYNKRLPACQFNSIHKITEVAKHL